MFLFLSLVAFCPHLNSTLPSSPSNLPSPTPFDLFLPPLSSSFHLLFHSLKYSLFSYLLPSSNHHHLLSSLIHSSFPRLFFSLYYLTSHFVPSPPLPSIPLLPPPSFTTSYLHHHLLSSSSTFSSSPSLFHLLFPTSPSPPRKSK